MRPVVYADVLVALNYIVNFCLLRCCARFSGIPQRRLCTILSAAAGAASSLLIFLPVLHPALSTLAKLGISLVMVAIAYPRQPFPTKLRLWLILFIASFLFAGAMLGLWLAVGSEVLLWNNGVAYFHLSPLALVASTAAAYLAVVVFERLFRRQSGQVHYSVCAQRGQRMARFSGREDSGNDLCEPFSGLPVIVCAYEAVAPLLDPAAAAWFRHPSESPETMPPGARLVYYTTVGGSGMLGALRPDSLTVTAQGRTHSCMAYLAVSPQLEGTAKAVVNPRIIRLHT